MAFPITDKAIARFKDSVDQVFEVEMDIVPPVWDDASEEIFCPECGRSISFHNDKAAYIGMLTGAQWTFTGEGARKFFLRAEKDYLDGLRRGVFVDTFSFLFVQPVPAEFCESDQSINCYISGFGTGISRMLALHLMSVEDTSLIEDSAAGVINGN